MKNYVSAGDNITIPATAAVSSGDGILVGSLFGIAAGDAAAGDPLVIRTSGVFDLPKAPSQAWAVGDKVYWDSGNNRATKTATNNTLIGVAILAVGGTASDIIGRVRLNGSF